MTAKPEMTIRFVAKPKVTDSVGAKPEMSRYQITPNDRADDMVGGSFRCDTMPNHE